MALKKAITQASGYDATYWRLTEVDLDWEQGRAELLITGYKDEQSRKNKPKQGIMAREPFAVSGELFQRFFDTPDLSQINDWNSTTDYTSGDLVIYGADLQKKVWRATEAIAAGGAAPDANASWVVEHDLRLNRKLAYKHLKESTDMFSGATNV